MPPGQPDHQLSSVDEGSRPVVRLTSRGMSTVYEQAPHSVRTPTTGQTTHDPVFTDYTTGRGHTAVRQQSGFAVVVVLRNAATLTVTSRQLQLSTQAKVSLVFYAYGGLTVVVHRVASPLGTPDRLFNTA